MKKFNWLTILRIGTILLALVALVGLFMPYEKSIGDYRKELLDNPEEEYLPNLGLKNSDGVNLTVLENLKIYNFAKDNSEEIGWLKGEAIINIVITVILISAIVLTLLFAILNKKVLVIIFDIILALSSLAMNYDITSRGALPSDNYTYGISYYLFIVVAVLILLVTIAMSILKKHPELFTEKDDKNKNVKLTNSKDTKNTSSENNKIVDSLKKYWYIIAIVIVVLIAIFAFVFTGKSKDNSTEKNNNTDEVDETDDSDNDTTSTFPGKTETDSKIEYTLVQTLKGNVVLIGKNKNDGVNDIEIEVEFYDKDNKFIGSASGDIDASVENNEFAIYLYSAPESYDHYKVFFDLEETDNKSYTNKLKVTSNNTGEKIVGQIENTTGEEIEYMDIAILFYKGDKVVGHDYTLESEIKAGRSANFEFGFPYDKNYDDVDFDTYKIFINDAYTYTW